MITCRELARSVSSGEFDRDRLGSHLSVRLHLFLCSACRTYLGQMNRISEAIRFHFLSQPADLSALEKSILERLESVEVGSG